MGLVTSICGACSCMAGRAHVMSAWSIEDAAGAQILQKEAGKGKHLIQFRCCSAARLQPQQLFSMSRMHHNPLQGAGRGAVC